MKIVDKIKEAFKTPSFREQVEGWTDRECLENFIVLLSRIQVGTQFIQNDDGLITHQIMGVQCGPLTVMSSPEEMDWPLQPLPIPEAFKKETN